MYIYIYTCINTYIWMYLYLHIHIYIYIYMRRYSPLVELTARSFRVCSRPPSYFAFDSSWHTNHATHANANG